MAIQVICPACMKRFSVSDKFAGRQGPCPNCQKPIKIPEKSDEVVIHAPDEAAPKDSKGRSVLKPIRRVDVKLSLPVILGGVLGTIVVFGIALGLRLSGDVPPIALLAVASIALAIPLVIVGYWFLHDDELQGFAGQPLMIRGAIVASVFAATWAIYAFIPAYVSGNQSMAENSGLDMVIFIPIMIVLGTAASVIALELEVIQGVLHYMFYFVLTFILAWLAGAPLGEPISGPVGNIPSQPRPIEVPANGEPPQTTQPATPQTSPADTPKPPKLLQ